MNKYDIIDTLTVFVRDAHFPTKHKWASLVNTRIAEVAKRDMMQMHDKLASLASVYPTLFEPTLYSGIWLLSRRLPSLRKQCACAMQILAKLFSRKFVTKCRNCCLYNDNIACHVMFHCVQVQDYRYKLWSEIILYFGHNIYNQHIHGTKEDQICDIISGMYLYSTDTNDRFHVTCLNLIYKMSQRA